MCLGIFKPPIVGLPDIWGEEGEDDDPTALFHKLLLQPLSQLALQPHLWPAERPPATRHVVILLDGLNEAATAPPTAGTDSSSGGGGSGSTAARLLVLLSSLPPQLVRLIVTTRKDPKIQDPCLDPIVQSLRYHFPGMLDLDLEPEVVLDPKSSHGEGHPGPPPEHQAAAEAPQPGRLWGRVKLLRWVHDTLVAEGRLAEPGAAWVAEAMLKNVHGGGTGVCAGGGWGGRGAGARANMHVEQACMLVYRACMRVGHACVFISLYGVYGR